MITRMLGHVRQNTVAYLALVFSVIGGGGGYAVAATTHHGTTTKPKMTSVVACASKKSGELFLHSQRGKCAKGRRKVSWNAKGPRGRRGAAGRAGAAGAPAPSIFAAVDADLAINGQQGGAERGLTVTRSGAGVYTVAITDPICSRSGDNVPTVTPTSAPASGVLPPSGATPVAFLDGNIGISSSFILHIGYVDGGTFVPQDYSFDVQDTCVPPSTGDSSQR